MVAQPGETLTAGEQSLLRLICDGATRFLHHQICEICADCLQKSRDDLLTCVYFCSMSVRLDETLAEVCVVQRKFIIFYGIIGERDYYTDKRLPHVCCRRDENMIRQTNLSKTSRLNECHKLYCFSF